MLPVLYSPNQKCIKLKLMNILICDDVNDDALRLKNIIKEINKNTHIVIFNTAEDALTFITERKSHNQMVMPDICFLDILMPEIDGITLARMMRDNRYTGHIAFLTNTNDYAAESYRVRASSYLLKPPYKEDVEKILIELENERKIEDTKGLLIKTKTTTMFLMFKDISHIEVLGHKVYYRLIKGEEIVESARFVDIASNLLSDKRFAQCHRSFVVNMDDVYKIQNNLAIMKSGKNIPISRNYADFSDRYVEYLFKERNK